MRFAICINNSDYPYDLNVRAVYQVLPDESAAKAVICELLTRQEKIT